MFFSKIIYFLKYPLNMFNIFLLYKLFFFQKEFWQHRFLPYYSDLESQANRYLSEIKAGMAHSIALNDPQVGFIHWTLELERYAVIFLKKISKITQFQYFLKETDLWGIKVRMALRPTPIIVPSHLSLSRNLTKFRRAC